MNRTSVFANPKIIFTPDGRLISTQKVTETDCHLTTIPGIYIVKVGQFATKVVVK